MKTKRLLALALILAMTLSIPSIGFAASGLPAPPPVIDVTDYSKIVRDPAQADNNGIGIRPSTPAELAQDAQNRRQQLEKDAISMTVYALSNHSLTIQAAPTLIHFSPFTYRAQQYSYDCGAASAFMALTYLQGYEPVYSAVLAGCKTTPSGTSMSDIRDFLNASQSKNSYLKITSTTKTTFTADMYAGIVTWDAPPILGVCETMSAGWPYNLSAHAVAVYGILSDKSVLSIADPWAGLISDMFQAVYSMPIDTVYSSFLAFIY